MLFLPGTLCTGEVFDHQAQALGLVAARIALVRFENECSLDEMADTAAHQIDPAEPAAVVGFSMGGMVALTLARLWPQRVAKLALINSNAHADLPGRPEARRRHLLSARREGMESVIERCYLDHYLHRQEPAHRRLILKMAGELGVDAFAAQSRALAARPDQAPCLQDLECPVLIVGSRNDPLCPPAVHVAMHELLPNSELVLLDDCGHFSTLEQAAAVSRALRNWYLSP